MGEMFHELASHKESKIVEGHLMGGHVQICISIPPKYAGSNAVGYLEGSAIQTARKFGKRLKNFADEHFWARGYCVSTVGLDEHMVRAYIRNQEEKDERCDQKNSKWGSRQGRLTVSWAPLRRSQSQATGFADGI